MFSVGVRVKRGVVKTVWLCSTAVPVCAMAGERLSVPTSVPIIMPTMSFLKTAPPSETEGAIQAIALGSLRIQPVPFFDDSRRNPAERQNCTPTQATVLED